MTSRRAWPRLRAEERGAVAIAVAASMTALLGAAAVAIDASQLYLIRTKLQSAADSAALAAAVELPNQNVAHSRALAYATKNMSAEHHGAILVADDVTIGRWNHFTRTFTSLDEGSEESPLNAVRVVTRRAASNGNPAPTFFARALGFHSADVVAEATAMAVWALIYSEPELTDLDPEAADYNRLSAYCFDGDAADSGASDGRSQMTVIADNAGTSYGFTWPSCGPGEVLSYKLYNVRMARTDPSKWDDPGQERYTFHTDTRLVDGLEVYDLGGYDILETVLCDSLEECVSQEQGGVIPTGKNRSPQRATAPCQPGKVMYYGWEDRPPGLGWTDRDYDDIRVTIACPTPATDGHKTSRLVR